MYVADVRMREFIETVKQRHHLSVVFGRNGVAKTDKDR
jgi:hypothetical protein